MNLYHDAHLRRDVVKILPGEYTVVEENRAAVTVLGSCVAACIRDDRLRIGGMNHFMLPQSRERVAPNEAARYGVHAMELLVNAMLKRGSRREDMTVKLFGGATVLEDLALINPGRENGRFAHDFVRAEGLRLAAADLYGYWPRKIYFFPDTGDVHVKYLRELQNDTIAARERDYAATLAASTQGYQGNVTWLDSKSVS